MTLLVNASNLVIGGGVQVGVWFIRSCLEANIDAHYAISPAVQRELNQLNVDTVDPRVHLFSQSPARNKSSRQKLQLLAEQLKATAVFTVFGPAYASFRQPHLTGFADGWVSHSTWHSFKQVFSSHRLQGLKLLLTSLYKAWSIRKADHWVFETAVAARGLAKRAGLAQDKCHIVCNNCSQPFFAKAHQQVKESGSFRLLYLTADYPHKGIRNFLGYATQLNRLAPDLPVIFVISIDKNSPSAQWIQSRAEDTNLSRYFDFCGPIAIADAPDKMDDCHSVMQMSYLETFSANYPEAMARRRPLIVSDFSFARDICGDAAIYVNPEDAAQVAKAIIQLQSDLELRHNLVQKGTEVLSQLPTLEQRFAQYLDIIKTIKTGN